MVARESSSKELPEPFQRLGYFRMPLEVVQGGMRYAHWLFIHVTCDTWGRSTVRISV